MSANRPNSSSLRKGSNCSTPITATVRSEYDYPSSNFVRTPRNDVSSITKGISLNSEVSIEEGARLQIRLHYNPVMDEWVSLTDERVEDRDDEKSADILFDLYKKAIVNNSGGSGCIQAGEGQRNSLDDEEAVAVGQFLKSLQTAGIRRNDPRLKQMMNTLNDVLKERKFMGGNSAMDSVLLNRELFRKAIKGSHKLISRAFQSQFVVPEFGYFCQQIVNIYEKCKGNTAGKVASYIPQLARYDPNCWGVSICTVSGQRFSIGDVNVPFTLQSCSKPFTYAVSLNELGADMVHQYVGQEPSGRMFNELTLDFNDKPHNPLLNSGAIMSAVMLLNLVHPDMLMSEKFDFLSNYLRKMAGGEYVSFNNSVFLSERDTADRNFALAYYMKENKCFPKGFVLQDCLDFYFQTCAMEVNCETISVMGATLANGGVCPITSEAALGPEAVRDVLSLMHSCGMYNYSGKFAFNVGLPAKSGVSGALVLVVPNVMGIGIWSPPLDALGNSVRGVHFAKELVKLFNFHRFDNLVTKQLKIDPRTFRDERNRQSTLCLLYSATTGDLTALKRFYFADADMQACNYDKRTALHLAACEGHSDCVKFLVEKCRISPLVKDRWGFTPLEEAKRFQHDLVFRYLAKYVEDNYPSELEDLLKEQEKIKEAKEESQKL